MAKFSGMNLYVALGGTVISNDISSMTLPDNSDTFDVSGGGDQKKSYVVGQGDTSVTLEGQMDTASGKAHDVITTLRNNGSSALLVCGPAGSVAGYPKYSGTMFCNSYDVKSAVAAAVTMTSGFKPVDGVGMAWGTF
jgi:hypothetical protein